jgi:hypothetical protein
MAEQTQTFKDVTIYLSGMLGVKRYDVREVRIRTGVQYAQYNAAIEVKFKEPRQKNFRGTVLTYKPFVIVMSRDQAVNPDDPFVPVESDTPGVTVRKGRYSAHDERYETDFLAKIAGRPTLFSSVGYDSQEQG